MKTAVFTFGRMNPVTVGHEKLVAKVLSEAKKAKGDPMVFLSHTQDKKKNPLSYDDKIKFAQKAFGSVVVKTRAKTIIEVMRSMESKYDNVIMVVGSDRVDSFAKLLDTYNGKDYNFKSIKVISAGERDPDSDDVSGMSASKMRQSAAENALKRFKSGLPRKLQSSASDVLKSVRVGMGLQESRNQTLWRTIKEMIRNK